MFDLLESTVVISTCVGFSKFNIKRTFIDESNQSVYGLTTPYLPSILLVLYRYTRWEVR